MNTPQEKPQRNLNKQKSNEQHPSTAAFVLCHSIDTALSPISKEIPPCLFPLCNTPVLFYTLSALKCKEIDQIFIICQESHSTILQKYINQWSNTNAFKPIEILPVSEKNHQINSFGDSIRWLYSSSSIVLNFKNCVFVPGTLVTNISISNLIKEHENRMKKPKKNKGKPILTTVFTKTKSNGYSVLLENDGSIIQLDVPEINFDKQKRRKLPFKKSKNTYIKTNLKDSKIYICSPELMGFFASDDNFDWNSIMDDCVPSIIDYEFDKKTVFAAILQNSFSSDVNNYQNYIDSTHAVIHGLLSPLTLDANLSAPSRSYSILFDSNETSESYHDYNDDEEYFDYDYEYEEVTDYKLTNNSVYIDEEEVTISPSAVIGQSVVIGRSCQIEDGCVINNSVIGCDCIIKKGSIIENTILWDNVTIEENVQINHSIIASDVLIKKDVKVDFGCIISFKSIIDNNITPCRRITARKIGDNNEKEVEFREDSAPEWLKNYVQNKTPLQLKNNMCFEYIPCPESEIPSLYLWYEISPKSFPIDISKIDEKDQIKERSKEEEENIKSYESEFLISLNTRFLEEAKEFLSGLLNDSIPIDQINTEFIIYKNSKYAENIECAISILLAISKHWSLSEIQNGFKFLKDLLNLFLSDVENQENLLFWWQEYCAKSQKRTDLFNHGLNSFIEIGSISNQAIKSWESEQEECDEAQLNLFKQYRSMNLSI